MALELKEVKELFEAKMGEIVTQVKDLVKNGADANDERIKGMEANLTELKASVANVNAQEKKRDLTTVAGLKDTLKTEPFSMGSFCQALYHIGKGHNEVKAFKMADAEYEKEVVDAYGKLNEERKVRSNIAGDGSQGGYLVPQEVTDEIIEMVIANMPIMSLGPRVIKGLVGDLPIPKITGRPAGYWLGEIEAPTESESAFGQVWLRPKKAGAFCKVSNRLLFQTRGVADSIIRQLLAEEMQLTMEEGYIHGNGTDSEPLGIEAAATIAGMTATTAAITGSRFRLDDAGVMQEDLDNANELKMVGNFGYLLHPRVKGGLKRERVLQYAAQAEKVAGPLIPGAPILSDSALAELIGYPLASTTLVRSNRAGGASDTLSNVYFGNWKMLYIGLWRDMVIKVSDSAGDATGSAFKQDQSWIVAHKETDCQVVRRTAFTALAGSDATKANWS